MDYPTVESGKANKDVNILAVTDHFTRYGQAFITPISDSQSSGSNIVGKILCTLWFTDEGRNFE